MGAVASRVTLFVRVVLRQTAAYYHQGPSPSLHTVFLWRVTCNQADETALTTRPVHVYETRSGEQQMGEEPHGVDSL